MCVVGNGQTDIQTESWAKGHTSLLGNMNGGCYHSLPLTIIHKK